MKNRIVTLLAGLAICSLSLGTAMAMDHSQMDGSMEHGSMGHGGMNMAGEMAPLGQVVTDGVAAKGMIKDIREAMAKMGMEATNHFMVFFTDEKTGEPISGGLVALKITAPDGVVGEPIKLMMMGTGAGSDITLKTPGEYKLEVGTKLNDGTKRTFVFHYTVK